MNSLSDKKKEVERTLRTASQNLEREKSKSKGVHSELKKLTMRLNVLQQNSPRSSSRERSVERLAAAGVLQKDSGYVGRGKALKDTHNAMQKTRAHTHNANNSPQGKRAACVVHGVHAPPGTCRGQEPERPEGALIEVLKI